MRTKFFVMICIAILLATSCNNERKQHISTEEFLKNCGDRAKVYNLIILDESGSMNCVHKAVQEGLDTTFATIKKASKDYDTSQVHLLSLVTFSTKTRNFIDTQRVIVREVFPMSVITEIPDTYEYNPYGATPLFDAIGISVNKLYNQIKNDENATAVITIVSDGMENSSKKYSCDSIKNLIEFLTEKGWSFSYMGTAHDVEFAAHEIGITNTMTFEQTDAGTRDAYYRESDAKRRYYEKVNKDWNYEKNMTRQEKEQRRRERAKEYYNK